jgi:predicted nucleic acid-binding protein
MAVTEEARAERLSTLRALNATYVTVPIDEAVASAFAELVAGARRAGRRLRVQDAWIASTAKAHAATVYTQGADFDGLPGLHVVRV